MTPKQLLEEAERARAHSYSPYSRFPVGAALLARDGRVFTGTNVENASFGLGICAERAAVFRAVSEGVRAFAGIAIAAPAGAVATPCGACRQVLEEFAPGAWVAWRDADGRPVRRRLSALLTHPFTAAQLPGGGRRGRRS